jgi:hypothetical protein
MINDASRPPLTTGPESTSAYADRLETAAQILHSHRHRLGWGAVCGSCRDIAAEMLAVGAVR